MILCAGEALIDMLPRDTTKGEAAFAPYPGGAVFNTAIALGRLGAETGFFTGLSTDLFGRLLEDALQASGVDTTHAARSDRPTTLAFVTLTDGQARYAFYDENTAGRMLSDSALPDIPESVTACFFGGISLQVEPCGATYHALMRALSPTRATMLDPNIRPSFIKDADLFRARITDMISMADIVKISDEDLHWLSGDGTTHDLARRLLDQGPRLICLTEGAEGARGFTAAGEVHVPAPRAQVVDTVGAGDTFNAGLLAALDEAGALTKERLRDLDPATLEAALTLGVRAAAVTVSRAGANPPRRDELP